MSPRQQIVLSAIATPGFAFIAVDRFSNEAYFWSLFWVVLAHVHAFVLVGNLKRIWAESTKPDIE